MIDGRVRHYKVFYFAIRGYSLGGEDAEFYSSLVGPGLRAQRESHDKLSCSCFFFIGHHSSPLRPSFCDITKTTISQIAQHLLVVPTAWGDRRRTTQ